MADIFDPETAQKLKIIVDQLYRALDNNREAIEGIASTAVGGVKEVKSELADLEEAWDEIIVTAKRGNEDLQQQWHYFTQDLEQRLDSLSKSPAGEFFFGRAHQAGAISGKIGGLGHALQGLRGEVMREFGGTFGVGGWLGLFLTGLERSGEIEATGNRAVNIFRTVGSTAGAGVMEVGRYIKELEPTLKNAEGDVQAIFSAMAEGGVTAAQAMEHTTLNMGQFGDKVYQVTYGLDTFFKVQAGTTAKAAVDLAVNTNTSYRQMVETIATLGSAAQTSGLSFQSFIGAVNQATSTLRFQRADAKDTAMALKDLSDAAAKVYGLAPGSFQAGSRGGEVLQGIAGALQGASHGIQAVLGQRIFQQLGESGVGPKTSDALEPLYAFMTGFKGYADKQGNAVEFLPQALKSLQSYIQEITHGNKFAQPLAGQVFGLSPENTRILMEMQVNKQNFDKLPAEVRAAMEHAIDIAASETSPMERAIKELTNLMKDIAELIITLLGSIIRQIGVIIDAFGSFMQEGVFGDHTMTAKRLMTTETLIADNVNAQLGGIVTAVSGAGKDVLEFIKPLWLGTIPGGLGMVPASYFDQTRPKLPDAAPPTSEEQYHGMSVPEGTHPQNASMLGAEEVARMSLVDAEGRAHEVVAMSVPGNILFWRPAGVRMTRE